jgi:hypothetical protein
MNIQSQIPTWLQWAWALAGLVIAAGGFVWILGIFWPYLRWSKRVMRQSLELGQQTAGILQQVQRELDPVIKDVKAVAADVRAMVAEFRKANDLEKISKALDKLATNGALDATLKAIQSLPAKLDALTKRSPQGGTMEVPVLPTEDKGEL